MQVDIHEAKTKLSQLGERVLRGGRVIITRAGKPVATIPRYDIPVSKAVA